MHIELKHRVQNGMSCANGGSHTKVRCQHVLVVEGLIGRELGGGVTMMSGSLG